MVNILMTTFVHLINFLYEIDFHWYCTTVRSIGLAGKRYLNGTSQLQFELDSRAI